MKFEVKGKPFSVLVCQLESGEVMKCQAGGMAWMSRGITMETKVGGFGKLLKRAVSGESIALNNYRASAPGEIAFAAKFPGQILAIDVSSTDIIAQKTALLACEESVQMDIVFNRKPTAGLFGGEGFIMQKFSGSGYAFLEVDGSVEEKTLAPGEQLVVDSGHIAAMDGSVKMEVETVKGLANIALGGEGLFNTVLTGPGRVWLQTMPITNLASALLPYIPTSTNQ